MAWLTGFACQAHRTIPTSRSHCHVLPPLADVLHDDKCSDANTELFCDILTHGSAIKASNIVIDADGCVQLCHMRDCLDMVADGVRMHAVHKYSGTAASIPWFAPEILDQVRALSRDVFCRFLLTRTGIVVVVVRWCTAFASGTG